METYFHMKGYTPRLAFKKRYKELGNGLLLFCPIFPSIGFLHHFQTQAYELSRAQKKSYNVAKHIHVLQTPWSIKVLFNIIPIKSVCSTCTVCLTHLVTSLLQELYLSQ